MRTNKNEDVIEILFSCHDIEELKKGSLFPVSIQTLAQRLTLVIKKEKCEGCQSH